MTFDNHIAITPQLVADHGYGLPGSVLLCSDSHTCSGGVFNKNNLALYFFGV